MRKLIGVVLSLLISGHAVCQDIPKERPTVTVGINVGGDEDSKGMITSYIKREFRKISDVEITDNNPEIYILVVAVSTTTKSGIPTGYALSFTVLNRTDNQFTSNVIDASSIEPYMRKVLESSLARPLSGLIVNQLIQVTDTTSLEDACSKVVAKIDGENIDVVRKMHDTIAKFNATLKQPLVPSTNTPPVSSPAQ
jgi:hypothetical protein